MKKSIFLAFCVFFFNLTTQASDPTIWEVNTRGEFLQGEARGVSITDTGAIVLAPKLTEVFNSQQSYVWSSAIDASGNVYLGTGNDGKIFKSVGGKGSLLTDLAELDVTALAVGRDGALFAGTSPDGKVYRIDASGKAEVYFDSNDKYIWSLAVLADGSLAVGTGENGKIYKVKTANAAPESSLLFDSSDTHIISLAADKNGNLYAGTDSNGLVLRISPDGKVFALLDAPLREIHEISVAPDGSIYALALSDSASASRPNPATVTGQAADGTNVVVSVTSTEITASPEQPAKSRYDLTTAKSAVYKISADGSNEVVWSSAAVTGFSVLANPRGNGVYIGTSDKGRIYSVTDDGRETLLLQSNEGQISTLKAGGSEIYATSSNQGKLYRFGAETVAEGNYESAVRDARNSALWGRIWWRSSGSVQIQTRSGNTQKPDETWSDWTAFSANPSGTQITSPKARFIQWRAVLRGSAALNEVSVSYLANNIAPEVLSIQIFPTNLALLANPQIIIDPNIEASGIDPTLFGLPPMMSTPPRRVYQRAARALQWTAEDRNSDKLEYAVYYRGLNEQNFKLLRDNLRDNFFTLDGSALADGRYVFKIVARDTPSNPLNQALSGERISEPISIDNSPPEVTALGTPQIAADKVRVSFEASDTASFINRAEYSVDGGEWQTVYADDGISDSAKERYTFDVPLKNTGEYSITLRVFDNNGNIGNARVLVKK